MPVRPPRPRQSWRARALARTSVVLHPILILIVAGQSSMVRIVRMMGSRFFIRFRCIIADPMPLSVTWSIGPVGKEKKKENKTKQNTTDRNESGETETGNGKQPHASLANARMHADRHACAPHHATHIRC